MRERTRRRQAGGGDYKRKGRGMGKGERGGEEPQAAMQEWRQAGRERRARKGGRDGRRGVEAGIV